MDEFAMSVRVVPPLAPWNSLQSSSVELERMRREGRASLILGGWVFGFLRQSIFNSEDVSFQSGNCYSKFVSWQHSSTFLFLFNFFSLNNNITVYFWNTDQNTSVVLFLFTLLSVLLCCWYFYANTSAVFLIFSISLWRRQLKLSIAIFMLVPLLQAASPFCVVIILAD